MIYTITIESIFENMTGFLSMNIFEFGIGVYINQKFLNTYGWYSSNLLNWSLTY
jgi:hypothetical protein